MKKLIVPEIYLKNGLCDGENPVELAKYFSEAGADAIVLYDLSSEDAEHDVNLHVMKEIYRVVEVPLFGGGNINRVEDVKKILYTGCEKAILNFSKESNRNMLEEVSKRFGKASVILISHRITTLSAADKIIVLDRGRIVEEGTHEDLKAAGGIYQKIYETQSGSQEVNA